MENLYNAMDKLLAAEDSVNSLLKVLGTLSGCPNEDAEKTAAAMINITRSVLKDVRENQRGAVEIIDKYLADNIKDNR